jgi:hypothetical protein
MSVLVFAHDVANAVKEHRDNGVPLPELVHVLELIAEELLAEERRQSVIIVKLTNHSKTREI